MKREKIAVKILDKSHENVKKENVLKEYEIIKNLHHKHIIKVYDLIENETNFFIFMMYIPKTLRQFTVEFNPLSENFVLAVTSQIVDAVEYLHSNGIAQMDIKPSNILIDDNLNIYITDFGLAENVMFSSKEKFFRIYKGTLGYSAPEVISVKKTRNLYSGFKADVWSVGICMYFLLHGKLPYIITKENMYSIHNTPLRITRKNIRYSTKQTLRLMLEKNPINRMSIYEIKSLIDSSEVFSEHTLRIYLNDEYNILHTKEHIDRCIKKTKKIKNIKNTNELIKLIIPNTYFFYN